MLSEDLAVFAEERITELTEAIQEKERYLKYAKDPATVYSLGDEIDYLKFERDLYLRLL